MKESHREGVTNHPGPEPCEGGRKTALEALDRGICRLGIELRNLPIREPTVSKQPEGQEHGVRQTQARRGPAESKTPGMHRNFTRENRETPPPSVVSMTRTAGRRR